MEKILVSWCLLGRPVRYDGRAKTSDSELLAQWREEGRLVPACPEVAGGLAVPRPPAELVGNRVLTANGYDVTAEFRRGAEAALETARRHGISMAILKEGSPSCGSSRIYDGSFTGTSIQGAGITTALLTLHGIRVFSETQIPEAATYLAHLEKPSATH